MDYCRSIDLLAEIDLVVHMFFVLLLVHVPFFLVHFVPAISWKMLCLSHVPKQLQYKSQVLEASS